MADIQAWIDARIPASIPGRRPELRT
jgi:hypothetical protein